MNNTLINGGLMSPGIYRAFAIKRGDTRVYIPGLMNENVLNDNGTLNEELYNKVKNSLPLALFNSKSLSGLVDINPEPCWVIFENGDSCRPIIMGFFGKGVKSVGSSVGPGGSSSGSTPGGNNSPGNAPPPGDSLYVDESEYDDIIAKLLAAARSKLGSPYVYGATRTHDSGASSFDCSGYIYWCYGQVGMTVGTSTGTLATTGVEVPISDLKPGDLIVWSSSTDHGRNAHVVMVYDNNNIIHCGSPGNGDSSCVNIRDKSYGINSYNSKPYKWARRIIQVKSVSDDDIKDKASLESALDDIINEIPGSNKIASYYFKNLNTNEVISKNATQSLYAASLIKLFVMSKTYDSVQDGDLYLSNVENLLTNMITVSDNNATNELAKLIGNGDFATGAELINSYNNSLGCSSTTFRNQLGSTGVSPNSRNKTSTRDCGIILEKIYNKTLVNANYSNDMMSLLKRQQRRNKIPAGLPSGVVCGNKTGETSYADNDAAIVFTNKGDYIFCVMIQDFDNKDGGLYKCQEQIKQMSTLVYNYVTK